MAMLYSAADLMFRRALAIAALVVGLTGAASDAQQSGRAQTETLSRRAIDRLEALRQEADRMAAEARTVLGDLRRLELERAIRATELEQALAWLPGLRWLW